MNNYIDTHLHLDLIDNIEKTFQHIEQKQIYTIGKIFKILNTIKYFKPLFDGD